MKEYTGSDQQWIDQVNDRYDERERRDKEQIDDRQQPDDRVEQQRYCDCGFVMIMRNQETQIPYCSECGLEVKE